MMDPLSITCGMIGVAGVAGQIVQSTRDFGSNYLEASTQIKHAQSQLAILQSNLKDISQSDSKCLVAQSSFEAISKNFSNNLRPDSKKARFLWAAKDRRRVSEHVNQLKETEISTTFTLQLEQSKDIEKIKSGISEIKYQLEAMREQHLDDRIRAHKDSISVNSTSSFRRHDRTSKTRVARWNTPMSNFLGADACLITSTVDGETRYKVFLRWRSLPSIALSGDIASVWSSWLNWSLSTRFKIQNVVSVDSPAVDACRRNDVPLMRELLSSGNTRPNDITTENHTLLYLAIRQHAHDIIQLLLDSGADPNLTCGRWETSPLNTAFYSGHVETVRLLLDSKADLDYINRRMWTSTHYIFDPQLTKMDTIQLLDVCAAQGFDQWDTQDVVGWTMFHRASAFGGGSDIKKLLNLRATSDIYIFTLNWLPIFCAVKFGNKSTFDVLVDLIHPWTLPNIKDSRGWTLLHLAVENGSEAIMTQLLQRGLDPLAKTDQSTIALPEELFLKELTVDDIASFYNNQDAYERALKTTSRSMMGKHEPDGTSSSDEG